MLTPHGSDGDVYPFLSIASALARRGHDVLVAAGTRHQAKVERAGIRFVHMRPDFPAATEIYPEELCDPKRSAEFLVRQILMPHLKDSHEDLLPACQDADLIVSHPLSYATPIIAEQLRIPMDIDRPATHGYVLNNRPAIYPYCFLAIPFPEARHMALRCPMVGTKG